MTVEVKQYDKILSVVGLSYIQDGPLGIDAIALTVTNENNDTYNVYNKAYITSDAINSISALPNNIIYKNIDINNSMASNTLHDDSSSVYPYVNTQNRCRYGTYYERIKDSLHIISFINDDNTVLKGNHNDIEFHDGLFFIPIENINPGILKFTFTLYTRLPILVEDSKYTIEYNDIDSLSNYDESLEFLNKNYIRIESIDINYKNYSNSEKLDDFGADLSPQVYNTEWELNKEFHFQLNDNILVINLSKPNTNPNKTVSPNLWQYDLDTHLYKSTNNTANGKGIYVYPALAWAYNKAIFVAPYGLYAYNLIRYPIRLIHSYAGLYSTDANIKTKIQLDGVFPFVYVTNDKRDTAPCIQTTFKGPEDLYYISDGGVLNYPKIDKIIKSVKWNDGLSAKDSFVRNNGICYINNIDFLYNDKVFSDGIKDVEKGKAKALSKYWGSMFKEGSPYYLGINTMLKNIKTSNAGQKPKIIKKDKLKHEKNYSAGTNTFGWAWGQETKWEYLRFATDFNVFTRDMNNANIIWLPANIFLGICLKLSKLNFTFAPFKTEKDINYIYNNRLSILVYNISNSQMLWLRGTAEGEFKLKYFKDGNPFTITAKPPLSRISYEEVNWLQQLGSNVFWCKKNATSTCTININDTTKTLMLSIYECFKEPDNNLVKVSKDNTFILNTLNVTIREDPTTNRYSQKHVYSGILYPNVRLAIDHNSLKRSNYSGFQIMTRLYLNDRVKYNGILRGQQSDDYLSMFDFIENDGTDPTNYLIAGNDKPNNIKQLGYPSTPGEFNTSLKSYDDDACTYYSLIVNDTVSTGGSSLYKLKNSTLRFNCQNQRKLPKGKYIYKIQTNTWPKNVNASLKVNGKEYTTSMNEPSLFFEVKKEIDVNNLMICLIGLDLKDIDVYASCTGLYKIKEDKENLISVATNNNLNESDEYIAFGDGDWYEQICMASCLCFHDKGDCYDVTYDKLILPEYAFYNIIGTYTYDDNNNCSLITDEYYCQLWEAQINGSLKNKLTSKTIKIRSEL